MRRIILINMLVIGLATITSAQNFPFGQVDAEALGMKKYANNETAHAVVLKEYGESRFFAGEIGHASITHDYHVKIKILDKEGLRYGKIEIPLYNTDGQVLEETIDQLEAVTIYKDENGVIKTKALDPYFAITVIKNKNNRVLKFELPDLKPGCVIEYAYHLTTPFFQNFHSWQFQSEIPKKISTYETYVPSFWRYNTVLRGDLKLTKTMSEIRRQCFVLGSAKADCVYSVFEMTNIPAFPVEEFMSAPKNFMSGLYFELSQHTELYTGKPMKIAKDWEGIDYQYQEDENFGGQFKRVDFLNTKIGAVVADLSDPLTKAKAVYRYIQQNMKWDSCYATGSASIRKAFDKHGGDAADINLLLAAALNVAGIPASPALLSTRDHGMINKQNPSPTAFNYVIVEAKINDRKYLLDATDPLLSFGVLPMRSLNDKARVLGTDEASNWVDPAISQSKNITYLVNLKLQDDGKLTGTLTSRFAGYAGYEKRKSIKKFETLKQYTDSLNNKLTGLKITKAEVNNLDSLDYALTESFDIEVKSDGTQSDRISFNPYMINHIVTNPFKSEDRNFPVDLGLSSDTKIIVNISYPSTYALENAPASATLTLPEQGGRYSVTSQIDNNSLSLTSTLSLKKPVYTVDEYQQLRELYDKVIEQEKPSLIFKKK
jgi:transglutaminase-like putative cysteine protease